MCQKFFFLHNPKAGGTSLRSMFLETLKTDSIAPEFGNSPNDYNDNRSKIINLKGYDVYFGHYGYEVFNIVQKDHHLVTNFRDPAQRIYSLYRYWKNNVNPEYLKNINPIDANIVMLSHKLSFSEFIRYKDDGLRLYIENFHFRQIYKDSWNFIHIDEEIENIVMQRIKNMPWFYIAETSLISFEILCSINDNFSSANIPDLNKSEGPKENICKDDQYYIQKFNHFDYKIYEYAVELQKDRYKKIYINKPVS